MSLYFFINHVLRRFVAKSNTSNMVFAELSSLDEKERAILDDSVCGICPFLDEKRKSIDIYKELSRKILAESSSEKSNYQMILYNELIYANKKLHKKIINGNKLTCVNTRYLFLVSKHYFLDNHPVVLLSDIMRDQKFFFNEIKRIITYPLFRDWITMRTQVINLKSYCLSNAENICFHMTELYGIFLMELYQSDCIDLVREYVNIEIIPIEEKKKTRLQIIREKVNMFCESIIAEQNDYDYYF